MLLCLDTMPGSPPQTCRNLQDVHVLAMKEIAELLLPRGMHFHSALSIIFASFVFLCVFAIRHCFKHPRDLWSAQSVHNWIRLSRQHSFDTFDDALHTSHRITQASIWPCLEHVRGMMPLSCQWKQRKAVWVIYWWHSWMQFLLPRSAKSSWRSWSLATAIEKFNAVVVFPVFVLSSYLPLGYSLAFDLWLIFGSLFGTCAEANKEYFNILWLSLTGSRNMLGIV